MNIIGKLWRFCLLGLVICSLIVISDWSALAQGSADDPLTSPSPEVVEAEPESQSTDSDESDSAVVRLGDRELFTFSTSLGPQQPQDRATAASENILEFASNFELPVDWIQVNSIEAAELVVADDTLLFALLSEDAAAANQPLPEYAQTVVDRVKTEIVAFREERTLEQRVVNTVKALVATLIVILILWATNKLHRIIQRQINRWQDQSLESIRFQRLEFLSNRQIDRFVDFLLRGIHLIICLIILYLYIPFLLSCFPATRPLARTLLDAFLAAIGAVSNGFIGYLPNLITIIVFVFIGYWVNRISRMFFNALDRGIVTIPGFYQEWAQPTANIFSFFIFASTIALIFPLFPASDSASFQGVSIFIGALLTLGSSTAIANVISGIISVYTRAFQLGDRIDVNGVKGEVVDKTLLSVQVLTPDNEVVTIPNSSVISNNVINYAASYRDFKKPLVLRTTVTLGYDVPWRKVYDVLTKAALATDGVLPEPPPVVRQTSLDDYYPSYCLKACTIEPKRMEVIYSQLHENIQDKCNEADIEILSPGYTAIRDGNVTTIPSDYLDEEYQAPGFRLDSARD